MQRKPTKNNDTTIKDDLTQRYDVRDELHRFSFTFVKRYYLLLSLIVAVLILSLANFYLNCNKFNYLTRSTELLVNEPEASIGLCNTNTAINTKRKKVWIAGPNLEIGYLKHVFEIFSLLEYEHVNGNDSDWDILWSHEYPFSKQYFTHLEPHQRVNHFPGSGYITNKVSLATSGLKHIPKAYHLPQSKDEFLNYAEKNRDVLWVQKSNDHRGIKIEKVTDIDLHKPKTFVQQYIDKPFLIDSRKFDIGLYVVLTSVNPLRVYVYEDDVLLRFCAHPYYPFDENNLYSYVVGDDYTPIWQMPSLKKYYTDLHLNMKQSLNSYLRSLNKDPKHIWKQMEDSIISVYESKEQMIYQLSNMFNSTRHFFELVRFDFMLDEHLNVYLMEANMSPNLSSLHFDQNHQLYENVIFNMMSLIGVTQITDHHQRSSVNSVAWSMKASDRDISVDEHGVCSSDQCHLSCKHDKCLVCNYCYDDEFKTTIMDAFMEHKSKWSMKRLVPRTYHAHNFAGVTAHYNHLQQKWFQYKCEQDASWC